jgi:hypothetical protein
MKSSDKVTQDFFIEVHLLTGKLVLVVVIHSLRGSRANWHHTPNPQLGVVQPTQVDDHTSHEQSTRDAFRDLPWERLKNPSQSPQSELETITNLRSMIIAAPNCLDDDNHQE